MISAIVATRNIKVFLFFSIVKRIRKSASMITPSTASMISMARVCLKNEVTTTKAMVPRSKASNP